jgi:ATP-dependent RNA helicase RhlE
MSFDALKIHPQLLAAVRRMGYTAPTPIQEQTIPALLEGRDVMGLAQTGTGKTAAFVLPLLHHLMGKGSRAVRALILSPTRELSEQTHVAIGELAGQSGLTSTTIYGGVNINTQIKTLRRGVDIVVACPGRLLDHVQRRTVDLSTVEYLVLDEADQMFDMGFLPDIRRIHRPSDPFAAANALFRNHAAGYPEPDPASAQEPGQGPGQPSGTDRNGFAHLLPGGPAHQERHAQSLAAANRH